MRQILFYGDSNTWGYDPRDGSRYPYEKRWTSVCAGILGSGFICIPAGMNGRTTVFDDPLKGCRNGLDGLDYELQSHKPLDLVTVMLGTNDLKYTDAAGSAAGMRRIIEKILSANERFRLSSPVFPQKPEILLVSPVLVEADGSEGPAENARAESRKLAGRYRKLSEEYGLHFLDVSSVTDPSPIDGIHLGPDGHAAIGKAAAEKIQQIFECA